MRCAEVIERVSGELQRLKFACKAAAHKDSAMQAAAAVSRQKLREAEELERRHTLLQVWLLTDLK